MQTRRSAGRSRWWAGLCVCSVLSVFACTGLAQDGLAASDERAEVVGPEDPGIERVVQALRDGQTPWLLRQHAAEVLIELAREDRQGARDAAAGLLSDDQPKQTRRALLQSLARSARLPGGELPDAVLGMMTTLPAEWEADWSAVLGRYESQRIADQLAELAGDEQAGLEQRRLAIRVLGEHRRPFAADHLMGLTSVNRLEQVQGWAFDALANLSHQPGLGRDRAAWAKWYNDVREMKAEQWQRMLHENLLRLTRGKQTDGQQVLDRLIQSQRALYVATGPEQRPALLMQMLQDPLDPVRVLAVDLARQRAEDSGAFGEELRDQLRQRLDDPVARVREESATLLGQLLDEAAADAMAQRLAGGAELEASVRRAYLLALTQMPRAEALEPVFDLLGDVALQPAAAGMLAAGHRADLGDELFWERVRGSVRVSLEGVDAPRPQMVTLLGLVIAADDTDGWSRIGGWLNAENERVREAAARVWAGSERSLAVLAERSDDAVIRPIALRAIAERGERNETLSAVAARRPDEADDVRLWEQAMVALAGRVPPGMLLSAVEGLSDQSGETRQVREQMLTASIDRADKPDPPTRADLRLLIARAQVRVLADAPALVILDYEAALEHQGTLTAPQADQARRGLTNAYLADGRIDDALQTADDVLKPEGELIENAAADGLIDSLIASARQAAEQGRKGHATKLIAGVRRLLGESLPVGREAELKAVQAELDKPATDEPAS